MRAGPMREWLKVMEPVTTTDSYGAEATEYREQKRIHAERVKFGGRRSDEAGEHFPDYSVQFRIRYQHEVKENWRVMHEGGYLYTVTAIEPNRELGMKTLICERVNE